MIVLNFSYPIQNKMFFNSYILPTFSFYIYIEFLNYFLSYSNNWKTPKYFLTQQNFYRTKILRDCIRYKAKRYFNITMRLYIKCLSL